LNVLERRQDALTEYALTQTLRLAPVAVDEGAIEGLVAFQIRVSR
jgi:hypothetical protein